MPPRPIDFSPPRPLNMRARLAQANRALADSWATPSHRRLHQAHLVMGLGLAFCLTGLLHAVIMAPLLALSAAGILLALHRPLRQYSPNAALTLLLALLPGMAMAAHLSAVRRRAAARQSVRPSLRPLSALDTVRQPVRVTALARSTQAEHQFYRRVAS